MPLSKKYLFEQELQLTANYGHVASHPARLLTLRLLDREQCAAYMDIVNYLPLSETAVSNHLRTLECHGLIRYAHLPGQVAGYTLRKAVFEEANGLLANCFRERR